MKEPRGGSSGGLGSPLRGAGAVQLDLKGEGLAGFYLFIF